VDGSPWWGFYHDPCFCPRRALGLIPPNGASEHVFVGTWCGEGQHGICREADRTRRPGANLRNVSIDLPGIADRLHRAVRVGKSSLAFDTIYAEGQRRYVESLSSYARQFLGRWTSRRDFIEGLSPAISIDQKSASKNPDPRRHHHRDLDYLRLLYARSDSHCPNDGTVVQRQTSADRRPILELPTAPVSRCSPRWCGPQGEYQSLLEELSGQGSPGPDRRRNLRVE